MTGTAMEGRSPLGVRKFTRIDLITGLVFSCF